MNNILQSMILYSELKLRKLQLHNIEKNECCVEENEDFHSFLQNILSSDLNLAVYLILCQVLHTFKLLIIINNLTYSNINYANSLTVINTIRQSTHNTFNGEPQCQYQITFQTASPPPHAFNFLRLLQHLYWARISPFQQTKVEKQNNERQNHISAIQKKHHP